MFESILEATLSSGDVNELKSIQDIDKYADFIVTAISTAVDKAIPTFKSGHPEVNSFRKNHLEKRRQYSQAHVNQLQKEIKDNLRIV